MKRNKSSNFGILFKRMFRHYQKIAIVLFLIVFGFAYLWRKTKNEVKIITPEKIALSPAQVKQIKEIGQWEFLSIEAEELIDTVDSKLFNKKELVRVYYGTLRLGVDLKKAKTGWISNVNDTIRVKMPAIQLLDKDFIDETRTVSFFETGKWTNKDRKQMYSRVYSRMLKRAMTRENIATAQKNAIAQMKNLIQAMGFNNVEVVF